MGDGAVQHPVRKVEVFGRSLQLAAGSRDWRFVLVCRLLWWLLLCAHDWLVGLAVRTPTRDQWGEYAGLFSTLCPYVLSTSDGWSETVYRHQYWYC